MINLVTLHLYGCAIVAEWIVKLIDYMKDVLGCLDDKTSTFVVLLAKDESVTIRTRRLQVPATEIF